MVYTSPIPRLTPLSLAILETRRESRLCLMRAHIQRKVLQGLWKAALLYNSLAKDKNHLSLLFLLIRINKHCINDDGGSLSLCVCMKMASRFGQHKQKLHAALLTVMMLCDHRWEWKRFQGRGGDLFSNITDLQPLDKKNWRIWIDGQRSQVHLYQWC